MIDSLPGLVRLLRGQIDAQWRAGRRAGHFLLLASASRALLRQSAESLAERVACRELPVLDALETGPDLNRLWLRGGLPDSFAAESDGASMRWCGDFIRTRLEWDQPQSGLRAPAETLRRFCTMLCHRQGSLFNAAELARSVGPVSKMPSVPKRTGTPTLRHGPHPSPTSAMR